MDIGMIGLGRMGGNMARRLARAGLQVAGYSRDLEATRALEREAGIKACEDVADLVQALTPPRVLWLMLPAGEATRQTIERLAELLAPGDLIVDGANSHYRDSMLQAGRLNDKGIEFIDVGVSGGLWGLANGYCLMVGGDARSVGRLRPYLDALAPPQGWLHCGPTGAGHFVKMVHNGIEYGMMQALAEGLALIKAKTELKLDLAQIAELWRHGSVVRSWLLDLTAEFLKQESALSEVAPRVADSGEGRWTVQEAVELGVPAPVIALSLMMRFATQGANDDAARMLALMRRAFGGHATQAAMPDQER
jgi:6-phosphogluconate dehydrogenase